MRKGPSSIKGWNFHFFPESSLALFPQRGLCTGIIFPFASSKTSFSLLIINMYSIALSLPVCVCVCVCSPWLNIHLQLFLCHHKILKSYLHILSWLSLLSTLRKTILLILLNVFNRRVVDTEYYFHSLNLGCWASFLLFHGNFSFQSQEQFPWCHRAVLLSYLTHLTVSFGRIHPWFCPRTLCLSYLSHFHPELSFNTVSLIFSLLC